VGRTIVSVPMQSWTVSRIVRLNRVAKMTDRIVRPMPSLDVCQLS